MLHRDAVEQDLREAMANDDWEAVERIMVVLDGLPVRPSASLAGAALWYAEQGFRVFPISPGTKVPYKGSGGCKDGTSDMDRVAAWWKADPRANIGIATGHLVDVVDFDGVRGHEAWAELWRDHPDDGLTPGVPLLATVSTPRPGGLHAYVRATGQGNGASMVPGVDYRGAGGYVLAPPSRTGQGTYEFLRPFQPGLTPWS